MATPRCDQTKRLHDFANLAREVGEAATPSSSCASGARSSFPVNAAANSQEDAMHPFSSSREAAGCGCALVDPSGNLAWEGIQADSRDGNDRHSAGAALDGNTEIYALARLALQRSLSRSWN
jgi:hypothetical protein